MTRAPRKKNPDTTHPPGAESLSSSAGYQAKVRMYRQGLGDCFLISLPRTDGSDRPYYIMIDCGVILGTADAVGEMTKVVKNIVETTQGQIDLLVVTHQHWDHLSGFIQAEDVFKNLKINEVWLGWTEDNTDPLTQKLKKEKNQTLESLRIGLSHLHLAGDTEGEAELGGILEFFGAAKGVSTEDALKRVKEMIAPKAPRYCLPTDAPVVPNGTSARFYVLGPPHDEKKLRKINPSARDKETYGLALGGFQMFMDGAGTALQAKDLGRPFDQQYEIPFVYATEAAEVDFFRQNYWRPDARDDWRRIDTDWLAGSSELALQLDSLTNNTSLVLAIELPNDDVLLFAADAQVGNWLSWQDLMWTFDGRAVTGPDILKRTIFYKVGHHGSNNATLKEKGLEQMKNLRVAVIPVDKEMAQKKRWNHMPLDELVTALGKQAKGVVLRTDDKQMPHSQEHVVEGAKAHEPGQIPKDDARPLFYEVTF